MLNFLVLLLCLETALGYVAGRRWIRGPDQHARSELYFRRRSEAQLLRSLFGKGIRIHALKFDSESRDGGLPLIVRNSVASLRLLRARVDASAFSSFTLH